MSLYSSHTRIQTFFPIYCCTFDMSVIPGLPMGIDRDPSHNREATRVHISAAKEAATSGDTTHPPWILHSNSPENHRPIKVIVIGAGFSGILAGIRIPERIPNCELVIYEKNAGIGTLYQGKHLAKQC
jgi:hypothetical protein